MGIFSHFKDNFTSMGAENFLKKKISAYGELSKFKIDSDENKIYIKLLLKGEPSPLEIWIDEYEIHETINSDYIVIKAIGSNREWLNLILNDHVSGKEFELPEKYNELIKFFL